MVLIDPDFLFLSEFRLPAKTKHGSLKASVGPGHPAAASYGLGTQWIGFDRVAICGADSPCVNTTQSDAGHFYSVGPPYIVHKSDVLTLARKWAEFVPPTYDQYPLLYAEMFAYSMAAAHLNLKHSLLNGLFTGCMVGWPGSDHETVVASARKYKESVIHPAAKSDPIPNGAASCFLPPMVPPPFLHYCQRYAFNGAEHEEKDVNATQIKYYFLCETKSRSRHTQLRSRTIGALRLRQEGTN